MSPPQELWPWRQPRWFSTLFKIDLWERFSFFGMMAILFLYASASPRDGGLGMDAGGAGALVGLYVSATFVASVPGGWLGDRVFGAQRAVGYGGAVIAAGHLCLALPFRAAFFPGIALIAAGTGLLKPNLSALLGAFYPERAAARREAGFSVFFISIQAGALTAPIVTGFLGERVNWHLGFGAAAVGMGVGLATYLRGRRHLGDVGRRPGQPAAPETLRRVARRTALGVGAVAALAALDVLAGTARMEHFVAGLGLLVLFAPIPYARAIMKGPAVSADDRRRLRSYGWVFLATAVFFLLAGQGNSVLNQFAAVATERAVLGFTVPASWFQTLHPLFVLLVAPVVARISTGPGRRLNVPVKLALGLSLAAVSFLLMASAAGLAATGPVSPAWLTVVYLLQACAELVVGAAGLGATAQIALPGASGQLMGLWWLAGAVGAVVGGQLARVAMSGGSVPAPAYFLGLSLLPVAVAAALAIGRRRINTRLGLDTPALSPTEVS
ncbi:peptide MFS transporter [Microtetraspora fusca]|uniref:peptide MFS transporter n=1 Tax=Microtetraspora fusca TaxID=1997 RepID=UPI0009FF1316|nr:peptide MFS transporter [Microtetraspora fusca]